jgi:uncharacterized protein YjbI with pentapeptide repeats
MRYLALAVLLGLVCAAVITLAYKRDWRWTGLPARPGDEQANLPAAPAKTLWDWLALLVVPLVLAAAAFSLSAAQGARQQSQERKREASVQARAEKNARLQTVRAEENAREQTLRDYLEQMSHLMLAKSLGSRDADAESARPADPNAVDVAETLTLNTLRRLDGVRKALVIRFLAEWNLITTDWTIGTTGAGQRGPDPVMSLEGADLREIVIHGRSGSELLAMTYSEAVRPRPETWEVKAIVVKGADLRHADFRGSKAVMSVDSADMRGADFSDADLRAWEVAVSCLTGARFTGADLSGLDGMPGIYMVDARGSHVDFSYARLNGAHLERSTLTDVNLHQAATDGTHFPQGWTPTGLSMSDRDAKQLCVGMDLPTS